MRNLGKYGFSEQTDVGIGLDFCIEHSHNTWWNGTNVESIRGKIAAIRITGREISHNWVEVTTKNFCSLWDGGIGIGALTGLWPQQWEAWYNACRNDFFTGDVRGSDLGQGDITFWAKNSLLCSKLSEIYPDSKDFWNQMGMLVNTDDQYWYDGEPWFLKHGKAESKLKRPKETKPRVKKEKEEESSILFTILYVLLALAVMAPVTYLLLKYLVFKGKKSATYIDEDLKEKRRKILEKRNANKIN